MKKGFDYLIENANLLPSEIAEVVLDFKYTLGFRTLVNKYKLHLDQAEVLEDLTFRVMFNEISPSEFTAKLVSDLNQAPVTAKELTDDTNENIIMPVKNAIAERIHNMLEEYKDIADSEITIEEEGAPKTFHPKSAYNEEITDDFSKPDPKHLYSHIGTLTSADILEGIENPHSSLPGNLNRAIKTASGSKSYSDVMASTNPTLYKGADLHKIPEKTPPAPEVFKPIPIVQSATPDISKNLPAVAVDPISMKSSTIVVSSPTKIDATPENKTGFIHNNLSPSADPYKETF